MPSSTENSRTRDVQATDSSQPLAERLPAAVRQPWVRPRLECFGDVRQVTMGGSPGVFESNNPGNRAPRRG